MPKPPARRKAARTAARTWSSRAPASIRRFRRFSNRSLESVRAAWRSPKSSIDNRDPERRYLPGHPDADKDGYVAFPRINPAEDMVDLMGASRSYQANVAAISAVKDMIQRSIDLFR